MILRPCLQCRRHIAARDYTCTFCGTDQPNAARPAAPSIAGRVSRAAVFAGMTACWSGNTPPQTTPIEHTQQAPATQPMLSGVVFDETQGIPLANATVALVDDKAEVIATAKTDSKGRYHFDKVPPGFYDITASYFDGARRSQDGVTSVEVATTPQRADITIATFDRANMAKPYGAPPARRRVV